MILAAGPLALWGVWAMWVSIPLGHWMGALFGGAAVVTAVGLLRMRGWAKPMAYFLATALALTWAYRVWQIALRGWPYADWYRTILSLIPGALFLFLCAGGAWIVHKQYRRHRSET
jgi:hypothetical protein